MAYNNTTTGIEGNQTQPNPQTGSGQAGKMQNYGMIIGAVNKLSDVAVEEVGEDTKIGEAGQQGRPDRAVGNLVKRAASGDYLGAGANLLTGGVSEFVGPLVGVESPARKEAREAQEQAEAKLSITKNFEQNYNPAIASSVNNIPIAANGGQLNGGQSGFNEYVGGGNHEQNPNGGIPVDNQGRPAVNSQKPVAALVESGEISYDDYVFSNRLKDKGRSFSKQAKSIRNKYSMREGDQLTKDVMESELLGLVKKQESARELDNQKYGVPIMAQGGGLDGRFGRTYTNDERSGMIKSSLYNPHGSNFGGFDADKQFNTWENDRSNYDSNNPDMKSLQTEMMNLGYYDNLYKNGTSAGTIVDGKFGPKTKIAYDRYKKVNNDSLMSSNQSAIDNLGNIFPTQQSQSNITNTDQQRVDLLAPNEPVDMNGKVQQAPQVGFEGFDINQTPNLPNSIPGANTPPSGGTPDLTQTDAEIGNYRQQAMKDYAPGMIAAGLGSAYEYMTAKGDPRSYDRINPELVDYTAARTNIKNQAATSRNIATDYIGRNASSGGNTMTNILASNAAINTGVSKGLSDSFEGEINTNTGLINQANQTNQRIGMMEADNNYGDRRRVEEQKISGVLNTANQYQNYIKDVNASAKDKELANFAGTSNFGVYTDKHGQKRPIFKDLETGKSYYNDDNGNKIPIN